jgi:hypothetical protein
VQVEFDPFTKPFKRFTLEVSRPDIELTGYAFLKRPIEKQPYYRELIINYKPRPDIISINVPESREGDSVLLTLRVDAPPTQAMAPSASELDKSLNVRVVP